ncbi:MAG TPA: PLP-dependent aminotransferase family protein [Tepidiformaceae bacterium]|nr:PLP-dependent aminotransferase family protein [Tepidiformaceae bacterium]
MDVLFDVPRDGGLRSGIEQGLRTAIREGRLAAGSVLPSTRALAAELGVARGTVVEAYGQLVSEGYLVARQGAPTRVAAAPGRTTASTEPEAAGAAYRFDLRPGAPDPDAFPLTEWVAAIRRVARTLPGEATGYGDGRGRIELRVALADYLARARGVAADPERIVVCSGFTLGVGLVLGALRRGGVRRVGMEDPGLAPHREVVRDALGDGGEVVPVAVGDSGVEIEAVRAADPDAVLVTPAHQYPLGVAMSAGRRAELIAWATEHGRFVIEDDYDGELRYDRQPVGALQGLAPGRVAYVGTASKSMAPGLRMGWVVLPEELVGPVSDLKRYRETVPVLDQLAMADLIASGRFERLLRKRRQEYRRRRDLFVRTVGEAAPWVTVRGLAAGLNAVLELPAGGPGEQEALTVLRRRSVAVTGLRSHWHGAETARRFPGIVVAYGRPRGHEAAAAFRALGEGLREVAAGGA